MRIGGAALKERKMGVVAAVLVLMLACTAAGYFLGRATVSPGVAATVVTERSAPAQEAALTAPGAVQKQLEQPEQMEQIPEERPPSGTAEEEGPVHINTASLEELETLPGIGPKLAGRIVAYREENGPFTTVEELCEVSGIGEKVLEKIRARIVVGG